MDRANKTPQPALCGVLVVDKPLGPSSMAVVSRVRRKAGGARTGHAGTLDPLACGVLVLAVGRATKILGRLMATDKRYRTQIDLGAFTTTDDLEGERIEVDVKAPPSEDDVKSVLHRFVGEQTQRPPVFSAVKIGGRRAYQLARRGTVVEMPTRSVTLHAVELVRYAWPLLEVDVHCGKGVYIRSLARDIGEALGTGGHCRSLRRTAVGPFIEQMAVGLDAVPDPLTDKDLIAPERALEMVGDSSC